MLNRHHIAKLAAAITRTQFRGFSQTKSTLIDVKSHSSVNDTVNYLNNNTLESDSDLKNADTYHDIISHHATRLDNATDQSIIDKEYDDLYTLSLKLSKLLESTPDVSEEYKKTILNSLIERFTKYNYAVSTLAFKRLLEDKDNLTHDSINQLITHNPGRVNSTWDLYNNLKPEQSHDEILVSTFKKLLNGDPVEIKEDLHKVDIDKLIKICEIYENIGQKDLIDDATLAEFIKNLIKLDCAEIITTMAVPSSIFEIFINHCESYDLKNLHYLVFYEASINNGVSLSGNALLKSLIPISKLQLTNLVESDNLKKLKEKLNIQPIQLAPLSDVVDEIREQILELGLDDEVSIKLDLIRSAGFYSKDLQTAIKYFQNYQPRIPDGTPAQNSLKSLMSLVFTYDCIDKEDSKMINVAEVLVPQTPLPAANNLSALILYHGFLGDSDKGFDIYNKALNLFLDPHNGVNEFNRGMLLQSLTLISLLTKEVGLAKLIKEKSLENNLLNETYEIKISNIFKEYGDLIEEFKDNDTMFRDAMKKIFLRTIRELGE